MHGGLGEARLRELLARMTLTEKLGQLTMLAEGLVETGPPGPGNPFTMISEGRVGSLLNVWGPHLIREAQRRAVEETRLGVPLFFGLDVVHGHRTIHPVPIGAACAFDRDLWERCARDAALEAMGDGIQMTFAPMVNVARDARWGRIVETPGEDPFVASAFARAHVRGFQAAQSDGRMTLAACAKHFCAYGAVLGGRDYAEVDVSERALHEIYLPPFEAAVEEGVAAIMPAFVDVAGVAMTANKRLLRDVLRARWRFDGLIVSDYNAVAELVQHGVAGDLAEAAALALEAGVDIDMMSGAYENGLPRALERGLATMAQIDEAVLRVLRFKQAMGLFEDPYRGMREEAPGAHDAPRRALARRAAREAIVLLENRDDILPLRDPRRIAVLGPLADTATDLLGAWASAGRPEDGSSALAGVRAAFPHADVAHAAGGGFEDFDRKAIADAADLARDADAIVLCLGESRLMNGEAASRTRPQLPRGQRELARAALATGRPVILVLCAGRPLVLPTWLAEKARAILVAWHGGVEAGHAIGDVLCGAAEPSGRLAVSWPARLGQTPIFFGVRPTGRPHDPQNGWSTGFIDSPYAPRWAFGEGRGYASIARAAAVLAQTRLGPDDATTLTVRMRNDSPREASETMFLFSRDPVAQVTRPVLELRDFQRVTLAPGEERAIVFALRASDFRYAGLDMKPRLDDGAIELRVGVSARAEDLETLALEIVGAQEDRRETASVV